MEAFYLDRTQCGQSVSRIALTRKYSCLQESDKEIFCQKPSYFDDLCVLWQSPAFLIVVQHTGRIALAFLTVCVCVFTVACKVNME